MNERLVKLVAIFVGLTGGGYIGYVLGAMVALAAIPVTDDENMPAFCIAATCLVIGAYAGTVMAIRLVPPFDE
jgi:hypothetical protein